MRKFWFLLLAAVAMSTALQSCDDEEVIWDGGGITFYLRMDIYDINGVKLLDNPDYETVADEINLHVEYNGKIYYLNKDLYGVSRMMPFEGFHVDNVSLEPQWFQFGIIYPGDMDNNYFKLKYTSSTGETVTHDIKVKVYDREKATKEHPQRAKYKFYLDNEQDDDGVYTINLK